MKKHQDYAALATLNPVSTGPVAVLASMPASQQLAPPAAPKKRPKPSDLVKITYRATKKEQKALKLLSVELDLSIQDTINLAINELHKAKRVR